MPVEPSDHGAIRCLVLPENKLLVETPASWQAPDNDILIASNNVFGPTPATKVVFVEEGRSKSMAFRGDRKAFLVVLLKYIRGDHELVRPYPLNP